MPEPIRRIIVCGPTGDYYFGDPPPPYEAGFGEFVEWQEAQFRRKRRPKAKPVAGHRP